MQNYPYTNQILTNFFLPVVIVVLEIHHIAPISVPISHILNHPSRHGPPYTINVSPMGWDSLQSSNFFTIIIVTIE